MLTFTYIDTCLPDYLTDHHNRDGEFLLYSHYYAGMTFDDLVEGLVDSAFDSDRLWKHLPEDDTQAETMLKNCIIKGLEDINYHTELEDSVDDVYVYGFLKLVES